MTDHSVIKWGCDHTLQYETSWIQFIFDYQQIPSNTLVLVESGLLLLHKSPSPNQLTKHVNERLSRLEQLRNHRILIVHLSDEEGLDGDWFYQHLSNDIHVWRNFPHKRFSNNPRVHSFPIGPRDIFLTSSHDRIQKIASKRVYPWAFMGTLWSSGSRTFAVSKFLKDLPNGFFYGGKKFGTGIPLDDYRNHLLDSCFALAPEGDRHLDTFRLWESLSCGCIPLLVDHNSTAHSLLGLSYPVPIFSGWSQALAYAKDLLAYPSTLDNVQSQVFQWWIDLRNQVKMNIHDSLYQ